MTQPASNTSDGNLLVLWVPALVDPSVPKVTELTAAGVIDLTPYQTGDGYAPGTDEQSVTDDRLNSKQTYEKPGRFTDSLEIGYVFRQQEPADPDNKAFATLKRGAAGYVVSRWGMDSETAIAATQIVDVTPAQCGIQRKQPPEQNSVLKIRQKIFVTGAVERDVAVVAGP